MSEQQMANYTLTIQADSGYESTTEGRCTAEQYGQSIAALHGTFPTQRTWVGLTDVEWMNIVNKDQAWFGQRPDEVAHEVAKLVESKLKEKNNG